MNYNAAYDMIMELQAELIKDHDDPLFGKPDYLKVKALAATYELQEFLANRCHEDLEEEIFRDMMQEVAAEEGRRAIEENERLKNDPSFAVPESLHKKAMDLLGG